MKQSYNPYDNVLKVVQDAAAILGYSDSDIEAIKYPERELKVPFRSGWMTGRHMYSRGTGSNTPLPEVLQKEAFVSIRTSMQTKYARSLHG